MTLAITLSVKVTNNEKRTWGTGCLRDVEFVEASYNQVKKALGGHAIRRGKDDSDGKVSALWVVECGDHVATVYDYKESFVTHKSPNKKLLWHFGGNSDALAEALRAEIAAGVDHE